MPDPATRFHIWVYRAPPDANCIVHTHPPYCSALSMIGEALAIAHMKTTLLHDEVAFLPRWPGVPVADEEGHLISEALGLKKRAILLAHHGQLVACDTVERAAALAVTMERAARLNLMARSAGDIKAIDPKLAKEAHYYRHQLSTSTPHSATTRDRCCGSLRSAWNERFARSSPAACGGARRHVGAACDRGGIRNHGRAPGGSKRRRRLHVVADNPTQTHINRGPGAGGN